MIDLVKQKQSESSLTTMQSIFFSILKTNDKNYILNKLVSIEQLLKLNEIEKQIIKEVRTSLDVSDIVNADYVVNKFRYYFEAASMVEIGIDQIDYSIIDKKVQQERLNLSKELLELANNLGDLNSIEVKERLIDLTSRSLLTSTTVDVPESGLQKADDAYGDLIENSGIYSLLIPEIERHTGKAGIGHVVSILAFVGSYKSTYALNLAYENSKRGHNTLYLTLESTEKEMISRMVLNHIANTATSTDQLIRQASIRNKDLTKKQREYYNMKHNEMVDLLKDNFIMWDSVKIKYNTFLEMTETLRAADKEFRERTGRGLEVLILDQLAQLKYTTPEAGRRYGYAGAIMDDWMTYFRTQTLNFLDSGRQITSFIVSQVKREAYAEVTNAKNKGRYNASAGGDSNEIERTSDTMITLYKDLDIQNTILVYSPKARHGSTPDRPIQVEVYGDYFHIGELKNITGGSITAEAFEETSFDLKDLLKASNID